MSDELINIADVKIPERFRQDFGDIDELVASLKEFGLLQPIIIDQDNTLVAGHRRLAAAAKAGWVQIRFERQEGLTELRRREIELEENLRRKQFEWKEEVKAIAEIHEMRKKGDPSWTAAKTATLVGKSPRLAQEAVRLAANIDLPLISTAETLQGAIQRMHAHTQLQEKTEAAKILSMRKDWEVHHGLAHEVIAKLESESIDCIITDPPFGFDYNPKGGKQFEDSEELTVEELQAAIRGMFRVLKPNSWLVMFYDTVRVQWLYDQLEGVGFDVLNRLPALWIKTDRVGSGGRNPRKFLGMAYETIAIAAKGDPVLTGPRGNIFSHPSVPKASGRHPTEKPAELAQELTETFTVGGQLVLDPFCGSGKLGVGALRAHRKWLGIDKMEEWCRRSEVNLAEAHNG